MHSPFVGHGGDVYARIVLFWALFMPTGEADPPSHRSLLATSLNVISFLVLVSRRCYQKVWGKTASDRFEARKRFGDP